MMEIQPSSTQNRDWWFWRHLVGMVTVVASMIVTLVIFAVAYLPKFATQPLPQQITIIAAGIFNTLWLLAMIVMLVTSIIVERPRRSAE